MNSQERFIEDLRDKHQGKEIWIIGTGSSLDDFSHDFFDGKITIALNWAIIAFPDCTYWHGHHEIFREYLRDEKPEFLEKSIILFPFPGSFKHGRIRNPMDFFGNLTSLPIWMRYRDTRPIPRSAFEDIVECIVAKRNDCAYRTSMTVVHSAIEAAAVMGAKKITIVGCEHRTFDRPFAMRWGLKAYLSGRRFPKDLRFEAGTQWLAELFGQHGIEVMRYYYKNTKHYNKGYERIQ